MNWVPQVNLVYWVPQGILGDSVVDSCDLRVVDKVRGSCCSGHKVGATVVAVCEVLDTKDKDSAVAVCEVLDMTSRGDSAVAVHVLDTKQSRGTVLLQFMRCWTKQSRGDSTVAVHEVLDRTK